MKRILTILFTLILTIGIISINNHKLSAEEDADPSTNYLCITAEEDGLKVRFDISGTMDHVPSVEYSTDKNNWTNYAFVNCGTGPSVPAQPLAKGEKIYFRATSTNATFSENYNAKYISFYTNDKKISISGNIMSLLDKNLSSNTVPANCFTNLFSGRAEIISIDGLSMPATNLGECCYNHMFGECTGLKKLPSGLLPSTTAGDKCYSYMFSGCTGLTTIPSGFLPATTLKYGCYDQRFKDCTGLISVPNDLLPACKTTGQLAEACYYYMFYGCTNLKNLPDLPATNLPKYCYHGMFEGCSNIKLYASPKNDSNSMIAIKLPSSGNLASKGEYALTDMFKSTGGDITDISSLAEGQQLTVYIEELPKPGPSPKPEPKDESCEKVIGPTWHWNEAKGVCEELAIVNTFTR